MKNQLWLYGATFLLVSLLTACGFHLRGNKPIPANLKTLYISSSDPYNVLTIQLTQALRSLGVVLVNAPDAAPITLKIFDQQFTSTTLSRGASSTFKQYTLALAIKYQLQNQQGALIYGPRAIFASRNLLVLENQVLSSGNEQATLKQDMQRDVMYQLLNQLSSDEVAAINLANPLTLPTASSNTTPVK